jgi:hypothetical protein
MFDPHALWEDGAMSRAVAAVISAGRVALGLALLAAPRRAARGWLGDESQRPATIELVRGIGARDLVLGAGVLANLRDGGSPGPWVAAALIADVADAGAAIAVGDGIPARGRWATAAIAGACAAAGAAVLATLD